MIETAAAALLAWTLTASGAPELTPVQVRQDFDVFFTDVRATYAYFDVKKTRWDAIPDLYRRDLAGVQTRDALVGVLERAIAELYDHHAHLTVNTPASPPLVPSGTDLWAEWTDGRAVLTDVRIGSAAEAAGLRAGAVVLAVDGVPVGDAILRLVGRAVPKDDPGVRSWALRVALAGGRGSPRRIEAEQRGRRAVFEVRAARPADARRPPVTFRLLDGDVGYVRLEDALGDPATVAAFDAALAALRDARALVVDLRETPSGGNSSVARGILGRFADRESPYQKHVLPAEERETSIRRSWLELVSPRGPFTWRKPVAVLVGRWTGSMGEGLAIGFDALGRGVTVGGPMAQLLGATYHVELPNSKIGVNVPAERLYHVNGTPREAYLPAIRVTPGHGGPGDAVLEAAVRAVRAATR